MVKRILLLVGLYCAGEFVIAQDRIITTAGDTINGKVIEQQNGRIKILRKKDGKRIQLSEEQLVLWNRNYYKESSATENPVAGGGVKYTVRREPVRTEVPVIPYGYGYLYSPSSFYWGINFGWGYRIGSVDPGVPGYVRDVIEDMRSGFQVNSSLAWFFNEYMGVGIGYTLYMSSISGRNVYAHETGNPLSLSDRLFLHYIGPEAICRYRHHEGKNAVCLSWQPGYGAYRESLSLSGYNVEMKGGSFISNVSLGYDLGLSKRAAVGFKIHWIVGLMRRYTLNGNRVYLYGDKRENISTIGLSVGFRFRS